MLIPTRAILKKEWVSSGGRRYPPGTEFIKISDISTGAWYRFDTHAGKFGFVSISLNNFKLLTEEEIRLREINDRQFEEHMKACDPLKNLGKRTN
jgi:hypothetical protein